jgi:Taurine catabolism dioxygenase TauD, TfdA family
MRKLLLSMNTRLTAVQPFHTDIGSIIGLYALGEAAQGGESKLASSATVYNQIAKTRSDIIQLLAKSNWVFDRYAPLNSLNISKH